jgi:hypothetical protein
MSDQKKYGILLALLFTILVLVEYFTPKPINWERTFSNKDKIPYGTYLLYELLPDIFPDQDIDAVRQPIANQLENLREDKSNYVFINENFEIDSLDREALLDYVKRGNNVLIAAENYSSLLENTLGFTIELSKHNNSDSLSLYFANSVSGPVKKFKYPFKSAQFYFEPKADTSLIQSMIEEKAIEKPQKSKLAFGDNIQILGRNSQSEPVFLKIQKGKGAFYLSSTPLVFCNYHTVLTHQNQYAAIAFSHLPVKPVLWDEYQKQGRTGNQSVLRVLMSHEPLSWAYYIALGSMVLFVIFESKRRQRIIPILEKPRNTTLDFVQVVGNLYFNYRNHRLIAEKKINYFFEFLRLHYFEQSNAPDVEFSERVAAKSGMDEVKTAALFAQIRDIRNATSISEQDLNKLNKYLEEFYRIAGK